MVKWFLVPVLLALGAAGLLSFFMPGAILSADAVTLKVHLTAHLLVTVIAISGVTIPLIILYRSDPPNIRERMHRDIEAYFGARNITQDQFVSACVDMRAHPVESQNLLLLLEQMYQAKTRRNALTGGYEKIDPEVLTWIFDSQSPHTVWFTFLMDTGADQPVVMWYLYTLVVLSVASFIELYLQSLGYLPSVIAGLDFRGDLERFLILSTFFINIVTYLVLGQFAIERSRIERLVDFAVHKICPRVVGDIKRCLERIDQERIDTLRTNGNQRSKSKPAKRPNG